MYELPVIQKSAWNDRSIENFVKQAVIPIRVAVNDNRGFPLICSLWFLYEDKKFYCATSAKSKIYRIIESNNRCAFEVALNDPPYKGVRGQAYVLVESNSARNVLEKLIIRYLGSTDTRLARWLLSREKDEKVLVIEPVWISSWDYSERMKS